MKTYQDFCDPHQYTHAHCKWGCEKPQPFVKDNQLICGRCWFVCGEISEMIPCVPDHCDEFET